MAGVSIIGHWSLVIGQGFISWPSVMMSQEGIGHEERKEKGGNPHVRIHMTGL